MPVLLRFLLLIVMITEITCRLHISSSISNVIKIRAGANGRRKGVNRKGSSSKGYNRDQSKYNNDPYGYQDGYPAYEGDQDVAPDVVENYMQSTSGKLLVGLSAAISAGLLIHFIQSLILARAFHQLDYAIAILAVIFVFFPRGGDWTDFCQALGVFTLLVVQKTTLKQFIGRSITQLRALFMLTTRRPFPPSPHAANVGRYGNTLDEDPSSMYPPAAAAAEQASLIEYSVFHGMVALLLTGFYLGTKLVKPIPLFPSWLGGLVTASFLMYLSTFSDSNGDFLRFAAYTLTTTLGTLLTIADEVELRDKTGVILGQTLFFLHGIDKKFQVRKRVTLLLSELIAKLTMFTVRSQVGGDTNENEESNSNRNSNNRRKGGQQRGKGRPDEENNSNYGYDNNGYNNGYGYQGQQQQQPQPGYQGYTDDYYGQQR